MASKPPVGSFVDSGRNISDGIEEIAGSYDYQVAPGSGVVSPLVFPQDIGSSGSFNSHFMVIDILKDMPKMKDMGNLPSWEGLLRESPNDSNVPILRGRDGRLLQQADKTIVVYMPNTLQFTTQNDYEEVSLTATALDGLGLGTVRKYGTTALQLGGATLNPRTEILFSTTRLREFQFDFLFAPSSEQESNTLDSILKEMRMAASPTKDPLPISVLWTAPRKLQIRFYQVIDGITQESQAIPPLKPVGIKNLDIDYSPDGPYSTFSNGYPVAIRMQLRVMEDEIIDRDFIKNERKLLTLSPTSSLSVLPNLG